MADLPRSPLRRVAVYCGSSLGSRPEYREAAAALAAELGRRRIDLVYGGGHVGLMGVVADGVLAAGGHVIGVIPQRLVEAEVGHTGVSELLVVDDMPARKRAMYEAADAFVALPGGIGTMEELFEVLSWYQLGIHAKPVAVLDAAGYYQPLLGFLEHAVAEGFWRQRHRDRVVVGTDPAAVLDALAAAAAPPVRP